MKEFTRAQIIAAFAVMVAMQRDLNAMVSERWEANGYRWHRAIWIEIGEWMDQVGWKWWKRQDVDARQAQLEVVDIFHFLLSWAIENYREGNLLEILLRDGMFPANGKTLFDEDIDYKLDEPARPPSRKTNRQMLFAMTERLVHEITTTGDAEADWAQSDDLPVLPIVEWIALQITFEQLYTWYVAKNVLNSYRQNNGYKQGTYKKVNGGVEDNKFVETAMQAILEEPDFDIARLPAELLRRLDNWYKGHNEQPNAA